jgi:prepilin signal peptidase PulO-like enzyme (type II secretory pathway)
MIFTKDHYLPFGPYLAIGGVVAMLRGPAIIAWYVGLIQR